MTSFALPALPSEADHARPLVPPPMTARPTRALWALDDDDERPARRAAPSPLPLSIVFPVWNEEGNLPALYAAVTEALRPLDLDYELLFVDNGSTDGSLAFIRTLAAADPRVRYLSLARNFGYQGGLLAGLSASLGQAVVTMDADLQHPPELIPRMVQLWREGVSVIYTHKRNYRLRAMTRLQVRVFYWLMTKLSGLNLAFGQSDFRLLDRRVVDEILRIPENHKFLRGFVAWVGFTQAGLDYEVPPRHTGASKFTYFDLVGLALDGIVTFSSAPLRWVLGLGVAIAAASSVAVAVTVVLALLRLAGATVVVPSGANVLAAVMMLLGAIQIISLGLLGEYVARIHEHQKGRPAFVVRERSDTPC